MRWIIRILGAIVAVTAVLTVAAFFLPREVAVARATVIDAPPAAIFPHVNALQATQAWSPWLDRDPDIVVVFEGPESGVGNRMTWTSEMPNVGSGSQQITATVPDARVETVLDFGPQGTAEAYLSLAPVDGGTEVTWGFSTDTGFNPMARWVGLMMDRWIGADYETGLARLKALVEAG